MALGVGLPYFANLPRELYRDGSADFVEITPEIFCGERRNSTLELLSDKLAYAQETCGALPITVHGVQLSIGSVHGCNTAYRICSTASSNYGLSSGTASISVFRQSPARAHT